MRRVLRPVLILLALVFLFEGRWLDAVVALALAKVIGVGITAFIFDVTQPKLMQLAWFRTLYERVMVWLARAHGLIDPIKQRLQTMFRMWAPHRVGRTFRLLARIRQRMQGAPTAT
jgi:hypothetical protein